MGRVTDWIVSSFQSCISCVSANDGDVRPAKAKKRKPRKFRLMKSAAVSPHPDYPKDKTTTAKADVCRTHADFPCTKGRPLPMPFTSGCKRNKVEPAKANKKVKGAHPCKCCVNTQQDPYKIKLRLSSKFHQHYVDENLCTTAGDKDAVMKKLDQEVREKVDRMFGKSETAKKSTNSSNGRVVARKTKKRGLPAEPLSQSRVSGHTGTENQPRRKNGIKHTEEVPSTDIASTKDKLCTSAAGNNIDGYCSHDDDDDIVIGNPTPVQYSYKLKYKIPVYPDDHDDDDDIVIGDSTPVPLSYKKPCNEPLNVDDDHDDDDDIVIGN